MSKKGKPSTERIGRSFLLKDVQTEKIGAVYKAARMSNPRLSPSKNGGEQGNLGVRIGFTAVALAVVVAHLMWPDLNIDAVTVGLLIIALLPWASSFIQSVEALGVKAELRQQIQEQAQRIEEVEGAADSANRRVDFAEQYTAVRASTATEASPSARPSPSSVDADEALAELASEYNAVRDTMKSSLERTTQMTAIVSRMVALAPTLTDFDVEEALKREDPGSRLAAYAYLYARPDFQALEALVSSVTHEDKPFNEYWGIRAIGKVLANRPPNANIDMTVTKLRKHLDNKLRPGTDRYYELSRILRELEQ